MKGRVNWYRVSYLKGKYGQVNGGEESNRQKDKECSILNRRDERIYAAFIVPKRTQTRGRITILIIFHQHYLRIYLNKKNNDLFN